MKKKVLIALGLTLVLTMVVALAGSAASGASFTTFNAAADGAGKDVCKNTATNCNIYGAKQYVWLNGGPLSAELANGDYFFAVLAPGGQPNPNDGGPKNLSDDYDAYTNRTFTITDGVLSYGGTHDLDSGTPGNPKVDGLPPYIRLFPYADTTNNGGVYTVAICSLASGYPVVSRDCKYDAFKVSENPPVSYDLALSGMKFEDMAADGIKDLTDPGLEGWTITIDVTVTGLDNKGDPTGEAYTESDTATTDADGYWYWNSPTWEFANRNKSVEVAYTVCEVLQSEWTQSYPDTTDGCYTDTFVSALLPSFNSIGDLDFGNWHNATKSGYKYYDRNGNGTWDEGEPVIPGYMIVVNQGETEIASTFTDENGYYEFSLQPGSYTVSEVCPLGDWVQTEPVPTDGCGSGVYNVTLVSRQVEENNNFGNLVTGEVGFNTKGYWHNKNGLQELTQGVIDYVNTLDPYSTPSDYFGDGDEPFDGFFADGITPVAAAFNNGEEIWGAGTWQSEVSQFLVDNNSGGGGADQEQLAQQLLAFIFNVNYRLGGGATIQLPDGTWMTTGEVINAAIAAWNSPTTDDDVVWEPILDALNNLEGDPGVPYILFDPPLPVVYP